MCRASSDRRQRGHCSRAGSGPALPLSLVPFLLRASVTCDSWCLHLHSTLESRMRYTSLLTGKLPPTSTLALPLTLCAFDATPKRLSFPLLQTFNMVPPPNLETQGRQPWVHSPRQPGPPDSSGVRSRTTGPPGHL